MAESIETRHENWLRVVWGLLYVREGLQGYVDTKGKQQYQTFISSVNAKCNNQTCDQCQINSICPHGMTRVTGKSKFRPAHFCDEMNKEIQNNHARNHPFWMNTDSTKWQDPNIGYWEVIKCYLSSSGYFDKMGASQIDASGLLSICINSSFIKQHITNIQRFEEVRDIRNKTLHGDHYELDGQTADDCLDKMIIVLQDPQELIHDTFAQRAAHVIRNIKAKIEKTPAIMTETLQKWLRTNFDVDKHLKEIEGLMYDSLRKELQGFIADEVKREVKHSFDDRGNYERENNLE
ncbi:CX038-like protein, partial [Mya arenaria]